MAGVGTTHHLKVGTEFLIVRPNTYQRSPAPTFGARITTGDPDYNNLSIWQHWTQHCWVGGQGADEWVDDAMYKEGTGVDTTRHEKATMSRVLERGSGSNWTFGGSTEVVGMKWCAYGGNLYCLVSVDSPTNNRDSRLYKWVPGTESWTPITMPGNSFYARPAAIGSFDGKLFVGGYQKSGTAGSLVYWTSGNLGATPTWTALPRPAGMQNMSVTALMAYNNKLYVGYSDYVWRYKDDQTLDGGTVFYKTNANSGSNYISAMCVHLGFLYMLSENGHLHRTDGNNTFDIWSWDGQTSGVSLRSYDGKLFVGTYEYVDQKDVGQGVLYQFTGAAVTELKRWGETNKTTTIGGMYVHGRRLYYGASGLWGTRTSGGFGVACYDAVEDAHSIFAFQDDTATRFPDTGGWLQGTYPVGGVSFTGGGVLVSSGSYASWIVDDVCVFGGKLFAAVRGYGAFFTEDSFRDVELNKAQYSTSTGGGLLTSSLYDAGTPGLRKMWRKVTVWCDLPAATQSFTLSYSIDFGKTWVSLPTKVGPTTNNGQYVFYLNNIQSASFQWRIRLNTTLISKSPVLRSVTVAYLPQPEPNWQWSFVIPAADKWELIDKTIEVKDTNALIAYFENLFRTQQLVSFVDIDGKLWATGGQPGVLVYDMNILHYDVEQPREADIRVTLLEAVESY